MRVYYLALFAYSLLYLLVTATYSELVFYYMYA